MKSDSIVIIPTYNEKENIENIIRAVTGLSLSRRNPDAAVRAARRRRWEIIENDGGIICHPNKPYTV